MLPSRRSLAKDYAVDLTTVQRAVARLVADGLLRADEGRGTFAVHAGAETTDELDMPVRFSVDRRPEKPIVAAMIFYSRLEARRMLPGNGNAAAILAAIEQSGMESAVRIVPLGLGQMGDPGVRLIDGVRAALDRGVEAVIVVHDENRAEMQEAAHLCERHRIPLIATGAILHAFPVFSVHYDGHEAGYRAAKHLVEQGSRRLLFFAPYTDEWVEARQAGAGSYAVMADRSEVSFADRVAPHGLSDPSPEGHFRRAYEDATALLREGLRPDGIVTANDGVALGYIAAARVYGLEPGRDYLIIGFDDDPRSREADLSTMRPPDDGLGREAVRLVIDAVNRRAVHANVCLHSHLIARGSTYFSKEGRESAS